MPRKKDAASQEVEVHVKHPGLRLALVILLVAVGLAAIGSGLLSLLNDDSGWTEMTVDPASEENCAADFRLTYDLSALSSAQRKELSLLYTQASEDAYAMFHTGKHFDGMKNLWDLSAAPGEALTVPPALYRALELAENSGGRWLYLAPVAQLYGNIFYAVEDREALDYDPRQNPEAAAFIAEALTYCNDPAHVQLSLLGENRVRLDVSPAYQRFAEENGIESYLDFFWMKNAFITDYLADTLMDAGFTKGLLVSSDGFGACLDGSGEAYALNITHREGKKIRSEAIVGFSGAARTAVLRDYPLADTDYLDRYYTWEDGHVTTGYVDPADGLDKCAAPELMAYSTEKSCGEIALALAPLYVSSTLDLSAVDGLKRDGIWSVYWVDGAPVLNDPDATRLVTGKTAD